MESKKETAVEKFKKGYNCCQAVACTYCEELGIPEKDMFRLAEGFGSGIGGLKDTCGAVMGMFLTISLDAAEKFQQENRSIYCRDLKNADGPQPLVCCTKCVKDAAALAEEYLAEILDR